MRPSAPGLWTMLRRGLACACPACGEDRLYDGYLTVRAHCPACHARLVEHPGDPWGFFLIVDRLVFVAPLVAATYFGMSSGPSIAVALVLLMVLLIILTTPQRYGLAVAMDYAVRAWTGDAPAPTPARVSKGTPSVEATTPPAL